MEIELISIIKTLQHIKNIVVLKSDFEFHFLLMDVDVYLIKNIQVEEQLIYSRTRLNICDKWTTIAVNCLETIIVSMFHKGYSRKPRTLVPYKQ